VVIISGEGTERSRRQFVSALATIGGTLAVAGCNSGNSNSRTSTPTIASSTGEPDSVQTQSNTTTPSETITRSGSSTRTRTDTEPTTSRRTASATPTSRTRTEGRMTSGTPAVSDTPAETTTTPEDHTATRTEAATNTPIPDEYVLEVVPDETSIEGQPVFTRDPSGDGYREYKTDLSHDNLHENDSDYYIEQEEKWQGWFNSIPEDSMHPSTKENSQRSLFPYMDQNATYDRFWSDKSSQYSQPGFESSETVQQAMNWIHPFLLAWDAFGADDEYNFELEMSSFPLGEDEWYQPTEGEKFAALFERALEENTDTESFFWSFEMYEAKEGGAYDTAKLDGEEVTVSERDGDRRVETIAGWDTEHDQMLIVETTRNIDYDGDQEEVLRDKLGTPDERRAEDKIPWSHGRTIHPKTENSIFLPETGEGRPGSAAVEEYWHPFRFNGSEPYIDGLDYKTSAQLTAKMLRGMVSSREDGDITKTIGENAGVAITNGYLADIARVLSDPGDGDTSGWDPSIGRTDTATQTSTPDRESGVDFENIYNQAKILHELAEDAGNYVVFGDHTDPYYAKVADDATIDGESVLHLVWEDEAGEYDKFSRVYEPLEAVKREENAQSEGAVFWAVVGTTVLGAGVGTVANRLGYNSEEGLECMNVDDGALGRLLKP